jgi:hypothetical protein
MFELKKIPSSGISQVESTWNVCQCHFTLPSYCFCLSLLRNWLPFWNQSIYSEQYTPFYGLVKVLMRKSDLVLVLVLTKGMDRKKILNLLCTQGGLKQQPFEKIIYVFVASATGLRDKKRFLYLSVFVLI